jgi:hypothetical protein
MIPILATPADGEALSDFYSKFKLKGAIDFYIEREKNFFSPYSTFSKDYDTYILKNQNGEIKGCATLLFKDMLFNGKTESIGYATDLRIARDRESIQSWSQHFLPVITDSCKKRGAKYVFSIIPREGGEAYNALVRPRLRRPDIPKYQLYRNLDLIVVLGRLLRYRPITSLKVKNADINDLEPLAQYLAEKAKGSLLDHDWTTERLKSFIDGIPGFSLEKMKIVFSKSGNIVGCVAPWEMSPQIKVKVDKYKSINETMVATARLFPFTTMAKRLPRVGEYFDLLYMGLLRADNPDVFFHLLTDLYVNIRKTQTLVYLNYRTDSNLWPPKTYLSAAAPFGLFTITPPETEVPEMLFPNPLGHTPQLDNFFI